MNLPDAFRSLSEAVESSADAEAVYGTPIERQDRTVVPVARVDFGLGGGDGGGGGGGGGANDAGGGGGGSDDGDDGYPQGSGLGGGLSAQPAGALEVTDGGTRFVRPTDRRRSLAFGLTGLVCGLVFGWLLDAADIGRARKA
ncbi:spore germination protein GerW family protein [Halosimplex sp. J119]